MSGSFTEQGNIATLDKFTRAKIAIECGADLVLELPTIYATSSAENFAKGAVKILTSLGCVTHLAFGAEEQELSKLVTIATSQLEHANEILARKKEFLKDGITSAYAEYLATNEFLNENLTAILAEPNNLLGVEYIKALLACNSEIKPVLVHRLKTSHKDNKIEKNSVLASSTAIREALLNNENTIEQNLEKIRISIPENTYIELAKQTFKTNEYIWENLKYQILKLGKSGLKDIQDVSEGLENRLYDSISSSSNYTEYIFKVKSKRYTLSRIKRICIYILLGITKEKYAALTTTNYARVLKIKESSLKLLSLIADNAQNIYLPKITDEILKEQKDCIKTSLELDILANHIVHNINTDYTNNIIVK